MKPREEMIKGSAPRSAGPCLLAILGLCVMATTANAAPSVIYDSMTGELSVDTTDGTLLTTLVVSGPSPSSIDRWLDGTFQDNVFWVEDYFASFQQWGGTGGFGDPPVGQRFVDPGLYQIATYTTGLDASDFPLDIEVGVQLDSSGNNPGDTLFVPITINTVSAIPGDYDASNDVGVGDLNLVLFNWNSDGATLPVGWVNERPEPGTLVGVSQLNGVLFNWGNAASAVATVPEPASWLSFFSGWLFALSAMRRR